MNTQNARTFDRHTNLTDATVSDVRRVLVNAFKQNDFYTVKLVAGAWVGRCRDGHDAASRILPIARRAMNALACAEAGLPYNFEG